MKIKFISSGNCPKCKQRSNSYRKKNAQSALLTQFSIELLQCEIDLLKIQFSTGFISSSNAPITRLKWCAKQIDLVELIYALYHSQCFGDTTIKEIVTMFENIFNLELKHVSHTFGRIRDRRDSGCHFITKILHNLKHVLEESYK